MSDPIKENERLLKEGLALRTTPNPGTYNEHLLRALDEEFSPESSDGHPLRERLFIVLVWIVIPALLIAATAFYFEA